MATPTGTDFWRTEPFRRLAVVTALSWGMMGLYMFINHHQIGTYTTVEMPAWVPFWPAFILPYQGLLLMTWLLPVALKDRARFRSCLIAYAIGWLLCAPWWVLTPTMLPRPPLPEGIWRPAFEWIWTVDQPFNVAPCAHAVGPIIAAWFCARAYPAWRWPLVVILLVSLPSIALIFQHRPIDILLGGVAAVVGIAIAEKLAARSQARAPELDLPREKESDSAVISSARGPRGDF